MSTIRKMKRQIQKNSGSLTYKKVIAKELGCSVKQVNKKLKNKEDN